MRGLMVGACLQGAGPGEVGRVSSGQPRRPTRPLSISSKAPGSPVGMALAQVAAEPGRRHLQTQH